jgi:hypothetical protein
MDITPLITYADDLSRRADELDALASKIHDSPATKFRCADGTTIDLATVLSPELRLRVSAGCSFNLMCAAAELRQAAKDARAAIETVERLSK